eukprot:c48384_g1_i1 orf=22-276(+)
MFFVFRESALLCNLLEHPLRIERRRRRSKELRYVLFGVCGIGWNLRSVLERENTVCDIEIPRFGDDGRQVDHGFALRRVMVNLA